MRSISGLLLLAVALVTAPPLRGEPAAPGVRPGDSPLEAPHWAKGDTWTLKALYRPPSLGKRKSEEGSRAGAPRRPVSSRIRALLERDDRLVTFWTFKVVDLQRLDGDVEVAVVQAKDKDDRKDAAASLLFGRYRSQEIQGPGWAFGLTRAKFLSRPSGSPSLVRRTFVEPPSRTRPVIPEELVVPHAFPAFPFPAASGETVTYEDTRAVGGMAFAFDTEQTVTAGVRADALEGGGAIEKRLERAGLPTRDLTLVEAFRPLDGARFRQLWAPGYPWPIFGESPFLSYHLVYHFSRKGRTP